MQAFEGKRSFFSTIRVLGVNVHQAFLIKQAQALPYYTPISNQYIFLYKTYKLEIICVLPVASFLRTVTLKIFKTVTVVSIEWALNLYAGWNACDWITGQQYALKGRHNYSFLHLIYLLCSHILCLTYASMIANRQESSMCPPDSSFHGRKK